MARNDIVLVDSLVGKLKSQLANREDSEVFELFCFDQVLKDFELSYEEIETSWTDGGDDGGVDGFFVFVDGHLITDTDLSFALKRSPEVRLDLFTVKRSDSFKLEPLTSLYTSIAELLDFTKEEDQFSYPFREEILRQRRILRHAIVSLADRRPLLSFNVHYCCRGETISLAENLSSRAILIRQTIVDLFGDAQVEVNFLGASELLAMARRQQSYSLRLRFLESYISREGSNYIVLASLPNYFDFITDEDKNLRRYLFDSNIRDYLGLVQINQDIRRTLDSRKNANEEDFWWFNNGVTILATHANVVGKEMSLENVQIVNGLQTTETIYGFYKETGAFEDNRAVLIKILLATDEQISARIIKATNYQNTVDLSALRGLDKIQRDIEHYLFDNGWYYDRRKNYYKNQGRPAERIISIAYLAAAVRAIALRDPARSQRQRARSLRNENEYLQVFDPDWDLNVYLASLEITHAVESVIQSRRSLIATPPIALVHYIGFVYACDRLGKPNYASKDIATLVGHPPSAADVLRIKEELQIASTAAHHQGRKYQGITLTRRFVERFVIGRFAGIRGELLIGIRRTIDELSSHLSTTTAPLSGASPGLTRGLPVSTPFEVITQAYEALKTVGQLFSHGEQLRLKRTLLRAAAERGVEMATAEEPFKTIFTIQGKAREEIRVTDAQSFLSATTLILEHVGVYPTT